VVKRQENKKAVKIKILKYFRHQLYFVVASTLYLTYCWAD